MLINMMILAYTIVRLKAVFMYEDNSLFSNESKFNNNDLNFKDGNFTPFYRFTKKGKQLDLETLSKYVDIEYKLQTKKGFESITTLEDCTKKINSFPGIPQSQKDRKTPVYCPKDIGKLSPKPRDQSKIGSIALWIELPKNKKLIAKSKNFLKDVAIIPSHVNSYIDYEIFDSKPIFEIAEIQT